MKPLAAFLFVLFVSFCGLIHLMNIDAYLERINYNGPRDVTAETLRALQVAHLLSVVMNNPVRFVSSINQTGFQDLHN